MAVARIGPPHRRARSKHYSLPLLQLTRITSTRRLRAVLGAGVGTGGTRLRAARCPRPRRGRRRSAGRCALSVHFILPRGNLRDGGRRFDDGSDEPRTLWRTRLRTAARSDAVSSAARCHGSVRLTSRFRMPAASAGIRALHVADVGRVGGRETGYQPVLPPGIVTRIACENVGYENIVVCF